MSHLLSTCCLHMPASKKVHVCAGVVLVSEWWTGEIVLISAGLLPHAQRQLSAMAVYMNTGGFAYTFVFGLSVACSTRCVDNISLSPRCIGLSPSHLGA